MRMCMCTCMRIVQDVICQCSSAESTEADVCACVAPGALAAQNDHSQMCAPVCQLASLNWLIIMITYPPVNTIATSQLV